MTVPSTTARWTYSGNGSTDTFAYNTKIFADTDLDVYVDGTLKTITTHYTVTGAGSETGGNVVFTAGNIPAAGTNNVVIVKDVPYTQATDLPVGGPFPAGDVEDALDKVTILVQQVNKRATTRVLRQPDADATDIAELPVTATRASKFMAFDSSGDPQAYSAAAAALLTLTGQGLNYARVNTGATDFEFRTPAQVRGDIGADNASNLTSGTIPNARLDQQLQDVAGLAVTDGGFIVGDGTNFVLETGATARTSIGLGTADSPQFTAVNIGHASDTTLTRTGAGDLAVEGNGIYRAGGTDVPVADGGTGASDAATAFSNLKQAATSSATGVVELATNTETSTGTDTGRAITPANHASQHRIIEVQIRDATAASNIKVNTVSRYNSDTIAAEDNLAKGGSTTSFNLGAGGNELQIKDGALTGTLGRFINAIVSANSTGTPLIVDANVTGGTTLNLFFVHGTSNAAQDLTALVDLGVINLRVEYATDD